MCAGWNDEGLLCSWWMFGVAPRRAYSDILFIVVQLPLIVSFDTPVFPGLFIYQLIRVTTDWCFVSFLPSLLRFAIALILHPSL